MRLKWLLVFGTVSAVFLLGIWVTQDGPNNYSPLDTAKSAPSQYSDSKSASAIKDRSILVNNNESNKTQTKAVPTNPAVPASSVDNPSPISIDESGRLSVQLEKQPLRLVLSYIAERTGIAIDASGVDKHTGVTKQFREIALDEGLRRLLAEQDAFYFYETQGNGLAKLQAVWVYPKGRGRKVSPGASSGTLAELEKDLANPDSQIRATAVEQWVESKGSRSTDVVLRGLKDREGQVRNRTLFKALNAGVRLPPDFLSQMALSDPSPEVRVLALQSLTHDPARAKSVAAGVMNNDSDEAVREFARAIYEQPATEGAQ